jgi:hypothetical protein
VRILVRRSSVALIQNNRIRARLEFHLQIPIEGPIVVSRGDHHVVDSGRDTGQRGLAIQIRFRPCRISGIQSLNAGLAFRRSLPAGLVECNKWRLARRNRDIALRQSSRKTVPEQHVSQVGEGIGSVRLGRQSAADRQDSIPCRSGWRRNPPLAESETAKDHSSAEGYTSSRIHSQLQV